MFTPPVPWHFLLQVNRPLGQRRSVRWSDLNGRTNEGRSPSVTIPTRCARAGYGRIWPLCHIAPHSASEDLPADILRLTSYTAPPADRKRSEGNTSRPPHGIGGSWARKESNLSVHFVRMAPYHWTTSPCGQHLAH